MFRPLFAFVDAALARGASVLVHCLAGAHRAGTSGVALLMHLDKRLGGSADAATRCARAARPAIEPVCFLQNLLATLERALTPPPPSRKRRAVSQQRSTVARTRCVAGGGEEDDRMGRERAIVVHSASERASASEMRAGGVRSKE